MLNYNQTMEKINNISGELKTLKAEEPETYNYNFCQFIENCLSKNGFLEEVK